MSKNSNSFILVNLHLHFNIVENRQGNVCGVCSLSSYFSEELNLIFFIMKLLAKTIARIVTAIFVVWFVSNYVVDF